MSVTNKISEEFLHFVWQFKKFNFNNLKTQDGEKIEIISSGEKNIESGPDFFNAKIKINNTIWAGNVEIHIKSSDWIKHKHNEDKAYDNVILHVVFNNDMDIFRNNGDKIPCLQLKELINKSSFYKYFQLISQKRYIPCEKLILNISKNKINTLLTRYLIERLEKKHNYILHLLNYYKNDWEQVFFVLLCRNLGFSTNSEPFELLAKTLKYNILRKNRDDFHKIEALLFGTAGFLNITIEDEYFLKLKNLYNVLKKKYNIISLDSSIWKFAYTRPANFPTFRIAQLASIIFNYPTLFSLLTTIFKEERNIKKIIKKYYYIFSNESSDYWHNHIRFGVKTSKKNNRKLGKSSIDIIIINTIIPVIFSYFKHINNTGHLEEKIIAILEELKAEKNYITKKWAFIFPEFKSAAQTQSILQLTKHYCKKKKCLSCNIGINLLK